MLLLVIIIVNWLICCICGVVRSILYQKIKLDFFDRLLFITNTIELSAIFYYFFVAPNGDSFSGIFEIKNEDMIIIHILSVNFLKRYTMKWNIVVVLCLSVWTTKISSLVTGKNQRIILKDLCMKVSSLMGTQHWIESQRTKFCFFQLVRMR